MSMLAKLLIGFLALLHVYFLWLEMFGWTTRGPIIFKNIPKPTFGISKVLAANQGLYNGFLAAGLAWSLFIHDQHWAKNVAIFFLACVVTAGIYGAITVDRKILAVQAVPAIVALIILL